MTLRELIEKAVKERDVRAASRVADFLRLKGFNYLDVWKFVNERTPISLEEWDGLMYDADEAQL